MKKLLTAALAAFMIVVALPFSAFAVDSPSVGPNEHVTGVAVPPNDGTVTVTQIDEDTYRLTATPSSGYEFDKWVIDSDGSYTFVEGDLNSSTIVIKTVGNVNAQAHFKAIGSSGGSSGGSTGGSTSPTSPATGDHAAPLFAISAVALVGAVLVGKKILA